MNLKSLTLGFLAILATSVLAEDVLYLKSGETIQGKITGQDAAEQCIFFKFADGREFRIRNSDILQMGGAPNFYSAQPNGFYPPAQPALTPPVWGAPYNNGLGMDPYRNNAFAPGARNVSSVGRESQETTSTDKSSFPFVGDLGRG